LATLAGASSGLKPISDLQKTVAGSIQNTQRRIELWLRKPSPITFGEVTYESNIPVLFVEPKKSFPGDKVVSQINIGLN
jgi:hypothetical protein